MALIKDNDIYNAIITICKNYYIGVFNVCLDNVNIYISDNIAEDIKIFGDVNISDGKLNGCYLQPNKTTPTSTLLINSKIFNQIGHPYVSTILHEITHALDFEKFCYNYCNNDWDKLTKHPLYETFRYWTEFHARITAIIHMSNLLAVVFPDEYNFTEKEKQEEMLHLQLPRYNQELLENIDKCSDIIYELIKYCSRFYAFNFHNPQFSLKDCIPTKIYNQFPIIEVLYLDLSKMLTYESAVEYLEILDVVLTSLL